MEEQEATIQDYSDNIWKLYQDAKSRGVKASEEEFRAYIEGGEENRHKLFNDLSSRGMKADENQFLDYIGYGTTQASQPTASQPKSTTPQPTPQVAQQPNEYAQKMAYNPYGNANIPPLIAPQQAMATEDVPEQYRDAYSRMSPAEQRVFSKSLARQQQMSTPEGRSKAAQDMRDWASNMKRKDPRRKQLLERADALDHSEDALRTPEEMRALAKTEEDNEAKEKTTTSADGMLVQDNPEYYHTKKEAQRIKDEQYRAIEGRAVAMGKHTDNYAKGSDIYRDATDIFDQTDEGKVYNAKIENSIQLDRDDFAMSMLNSDNEEMKEVAQMYSQFGDIEREGRQLEALNESLKQRAETLDTTDEDAVNAYNKDVKEAQKRYDAYLKQIEEYDKLRKSGALDKYNEAFQEYITENDESATKAVLQEKNDAMTAMFGDWIDRKSIPHKKKVGKDFTDEIEKRINERREDSVDVPIYMLNNPMQNPLGISGRKTESGALTTAAQYTKKAQDLISNDNQNLYANSLVKGAADTAGDMDFWTFGMNEAVRGFISKDIMDKVVAGKDQLSEDERRAYDSAVEKGYKNLTPEEEAATEKAAQLGRENLNEDEKLAYDAMQNYWQVQQLFKPSGWYTSGQVTAEALPFIVAMWGSGGIVNAIKGGAKSAEKVALRQAARQAEKMTFKQAAKNVGKAAGNMALEGGVYASTTGLPHTVAGTLEYLMPQSDATYDLEEGGIKVNRLEESEDSILSAAAKSWGTQMIEGMSEAFSTYALEPLEAAAYARLFGRTAEELAKGGNRAYKDIVRAAFKKGSMGDGIFRNVSSFPNEYIEELFGGFARCVVGLSEWDDEFSGETLAQTAYGLLPMQVVFSAMGGGKLSKHRKRMRQAEQFLDEFSPDSKALYDRLSGMSTYEGQDLLDREILSIKQEVDALKQADKFTPEMQQKMAARMNMALVMKEQLYMDEAAATIKDEQQRNAYETATSNLNEQNGNLVYAEYKDKDGNNRRGWIISQDGENTVISDGKKRFKVKSSDVTELNEYTMEEVEDHIIGDGGQFAIEAAKDIANPIAGQDYYDHRDDTPLVFEGGGMLHVDDVDDDGNVTFTLNGRQATVSRRQFREIVQQSRNNMEYAEADTQAFNKIGKGIQSVAVRSEDPMLNAQLGRRGRDARAYLAEAVGEERVGQMEQMDGKELARVYAEADATTKKLMQNWMELGGYDMNRTYEEAINERVNEAANQQYKRFEEFALRQDEQTISNFQTRGSITAAILDDGTEVVVGRNDGNEAVVMDMAGNMQIVHPSRLSEMRNPFAMGLARQVTQGVAKQMQALQTAYNGTAFQADTEHTTAVNDEGKEDKAVIVGFGNNGSVAYATEYAPNKDGGYNINNRSVKEVSAEEFRDMVEGAQRKAAMQQARKAEESKSVANQGVVKDGQDVTVMVGNKPVIGKYVFNAGHHFVVDAEGKVIGDFKSMDELKASMQEAQATAKAGEQMAREAELVEQSEMEKEYQRRLDEAKTTEERAAVIQEYLDQIKTEDFTMLTDKNYEAAMRKAGAKEEDIADFRRSLAITRLTGQRVRGFNLVKGGIFIHADDIVNIEDARTTYVHERQHTITRNNVPLQKQILNSATEEELKRYVSILSGGSTFYNDKKVGVVAEEFLSMAMEVAYKTADVEATLRGMGIDNEALIQTIKQLDNEQRTEGRLSDSRRGSLGNEPQRSDNRNDVSDTEREPGQVGEPRPRPAGGSNEEAGGSQEVKTPAQLLDELVGREGDNAANKLANTISAIQGSIATAEANLAEARQRRDNLPEPYNEETQAAMDAANAEITNLVNEIDNLNKQAAAYMLMQREQEKRFNEWMDSMSENEAANYSVTEADAERLDTEINLASEGTTEDGQQIRYSVSAIFQGIGFDCFDKEGNPMTDKDGNVIARIGDKVYDGHHLITAEEVAALRGTWNTITKMALDAGYVKQDAVDMLNQKYADIINSFLVTGLDENGGTENLIDRWMWLGETVFRTIAKNGDKQYSFSADITRLCKKNEQIIKSISAMQSRVGYGITPSQIIDIYTKTFDKGYQVPCPVCYVFNRYIRNGKYATAAIKGMERYGQHLPGGSEPWTAKQWKRELDRLTRKNETNKSNAKAIARAQKALDNIPDEVDKLGNMLMNDKTGRIKLTEQERNEISRRIEKLNEMYQAAMDLYANAAMSNWIKSFAIRSVNGKWVLYDDAKLPTDMDDFRDCSLDLRKTAVTIGKYPGVQRLRKSGGAAAGKEVTFASNNEIGEFLSGIGAGSPETAPNVFAEALNGDKKAVKKALDRLKNAYVYAQRQSLRGGQRMWSWSDNLENLMPDVAMNLMQLQLVGGALQSYSKQLEGINLVARMGGYVNGSLMAKDNGYRELTEDDIVMVDGKPTLKERIHETITERVIEDGVVKDVPRDRTLAEAGAPVIEIGGKYYTAIFDDVIGVDFYGRDGKKGLKQLNETLDKAGNIIVGMNDTHVRVCLADPRIFFCIPWHSSGASNHILQQMLNILGTDIENFVSTDYTKMQEEKNYTKKTDGKLPDVPKEVLALWEKSEAIAKENKWKSGIGTIPNSKNGKVSAKQLEYRALRAAIFDGSIWNNEELLKKAKADEFLKQVMRKMQERGLTEMTNADNEFIYPYEYWDESSTYDNADINGRRYLEYCRRLGVKPKFSGKLDNGRWTDEGNFVDDPGYWKLLIDRRMYGVDGKFQDLTPIDASGFSTELVDPNHNRSEFYVTQVAEDESISDIVDEVVEEENERMGEQHAVNYEMPFDDALAGFYNSFGITQKDIEEDAEVEEEETEEAEEAALSYSVVTDPQLKERLEQEPKVKVYRAMQMHDGKLYPPMAGKLNGEWQNPIELGVWEQADEHPELVDKNGKFKLDKGNGTSVAAAYNPYLHTSRSPLNDQFSSAWNRPELVTVEVEVPESELTSGYKADKAKDAVGEVEWKSGPVSGQLAKLGNPRKVILSRYDKPVRIVPNEEVAQRIAEMLKDTDIEIPFNTVTPELRQALEAQGVKIGKPQKGNAGDASIDAYNEWKTESPSYSVTPQQDADYMDIVNEQGELNYEELDNIIRGQRNELAGLSRIPEEAVGRAVATPAIAAEAIARGVRQANLAEVWGEDRAREHTRELIKQWAKQSGHWYDEARLTKDATEGRGGSESRVFVTNDRKTVRKLTSPVFSEGDVEPYIESLHLFGNVFGESAYDIKGFGENDNGELCVVVEQPYIQGVRLSDSGITKSLDKIREFMESLGFKEYGVSMFENDKFRIEDVNRTNVIVDENGDFHVIDAYVSLADESLYKEEPMYSFIGRSGAQRLDLKERAMTRTNSLYDARRLEEMLGNDDDAARKIKLATGWERGKDGKWRYEISDEDYAYYPEGLKRFYQENPLDQEMIDLVKKQRGERTEEDNTRLENYIKERDQQIEDYKASQGEITLDDVIDHEELFRAYPQLRGVKVVFTNMEGGKRGQYDSEKNEISISSTMPTSRQRSTLIHEIQHAIQDIEGFAQGGNPSYVAQAVKDMDNNAKIWGYKLSLDEAAAEHPEHADDPDALLNDILEGMTEEEAIKKGWIPEENLRKQAYKIYEGRIKGDSYEKAYKQWYDKLREAGRTNYFEGSPFDLYKRLAGEVEARNTQARLGMTYQERLESLAKETEDVAREDQLIMMAGDPILYSVTANEDTDMGRPTMKEITTEYLWKLAEQQQNDWLARADAVTAFNQLLAETMLEMRNMGKADKLSKKTQGQISRATEGSARAQERFDKAKAEKVMRMAQMMMRYGNMDSLTRGEVNRLMSAMKNAIEPQGMFEQAQKVIDIMVQHQLRDAAKVFGKQLRTKTSKLNASGVEVQAGLDLQGQHVIKVLRDAIKIKDVAEFNEKLRDAMDGMGSDSKTKSENASLDYAGLLLAKQYIESVRDNAEQEKAIKKDLKDKRAEIYDEDGKLKPKFKGKLDEEHARIKREVQQYEKAANERLRDLRMERIDAYARLSKDLADVISGSRDRAKEWAEREMERAREIQHNANSDLQGIPAREQPRTRKELSFGERLAGSGLTQLLTSSTRNFNEYLRFFGDKSPDGRGYLWNRFMPQVTEARDSEWANLQYELSRLNTKVAELTNGKAQDVADLMAMGRKMPTITVSYRDGDEITPHEMTQGEALYIYMVNKMSDGAMKLRSMGITEEDVQDIESQLDNTFLEFADWVQEDYLPSIRERYNEVHQRMFGAPMANITDYFPLKINSDSREKEEQLGVEFDKDMPSTVTGAIIARKHNNTALNLKSDAMSVLIQHVMEMEHWAAYAELSRDLGTLLSYKRFRNRAKNMSSARLGGAARVNANGKEDKSNIFENFKKTCNIVCGTFSPTSKTDEIDKQVRNIVKGVTAAKINFRIYTAAKQITSAPAFWTKAAPQDIAKNLFPILTKDTDTGELMTTWRWAIENLPGFAKRWQSRQAGNEMLDTTDTDWGIWKNKFVAAASRIGMTPNAFVDAMTVIAGSKAVFDTSFRRYKNAGYSEEEAKKKALLDASVAYNESQQSQDPTYLSIMQANRTFLNSAFSLFRNSSFGYWRNYTRAIHNIKKMSKKGYKEETLEFLTKQAMRDGLTEEQAKKLASKTYSRQWYRSIADVALFGFIIEFAWNIAPYAVYLIGGDDKKKKREMLTDAARHSVFGSIEGMPGGNIASTFINDLWAGRDVSSFSYHLLPILSDIEKIKSEYATDKVAMANDIIGLLLSSFSGVDPRGVSDIVVAIMDACNGDPELSIGAALLIMRIAEVPQSQLDELMIDEIGMTAGEARRLPADQVAKRYANYKLHRNAPLTSWAYDDEAKQKKLTKYENVLLKKAEDRLNSMSDEDAATYFDETDDITVKRKMAKEIYSEYGLDNDYEGAKPTKSDSETTTRKKITYQKMRTLEDVKEDAALRSYMSGLDHESKEYKAVSKDKKELDKVKEFLGDKKDENDKKAMERYRSIRKKIIDKYNIEVK